jgi:hypothetical protein
LPDAELPDLSKKISDIIGRLSVSCPQRNALVALLNYINAQGSIVLGYTEDILTPRNQSGDVMPAIGWTLWSVPSTGFSTWGVDFVKRVQYVSSQGGDITFILPEGEKGYTFTAQGVFTSFCIWNEVKGLINKYMGDNTDYKLKLSKVIADYILLNINDRKDLKNLYAYHIFRQVYTLCNKPDSPISDTPVDISTIRKHIKTAVEAWDDGDMYEDDQKGATSHFEFTYLLWEGIKFKTIGSEEKIQSFMDFSTGKPGTVQATAQAIFHRKIKALMVPST